MTGQERAAAKVAPVRISIREEQRQLTRRRILDSATAIFSAQGFTGTSVGDITTRAGINRATFYMHFTSKADVLQGAAEPAMRAAETNWSELDAVLTCGDTAKLRAWLESALEWWEQNSDILPSVREAMLVDKQVWQHFDVAVDDFSRRIESYLDHFTPDQRVDARARVQLLVAQLDHVLMMNVFRTGVGIDRDRLLNILTDMWVRTLDLPHR